MEKYKGYVIGQKATVHADGCIVNRALDGKRVQILGFDKKYGNLLVECNGTRYWVPANNTYIN